MTDKALVVLSGGQDSTTCLYWAIDRFGVENVSSVTFDYGQRHRIELDCAREIANDTGVPNVVLPIDTFAALSADALTNPDIAVDTHLDVETGLPNTFVPGRNVIFLTYAAAMAYQHGISHIVAGMAQTDYSGYPDCREKTINSLQNSLRLGMATDITIHTPATTASARHAGIAPLVSCVPGASQRPECRIH